jgi:hypothetical protein
MYHEYIVIVVDLSFGHWGVNLLMMDDLKPDMGPTVQLANDVAKNG